MSRVGPNSALRQAETGQRQGSRRVLVQRTHNPKASWTSIFRRQPDSPRDIEYVSIHYPRLFFFNLVFLVPFAVSVLLLFLQDVFVTFTRDYSLQMVGFDFKIGVFSFAYQIDDIDYHDGTTPYRQYWTVQSYSSFCSSVPFQTQFSAGDLIDRNFFCTMPYWSMVQYLSCAAVGCGVLFGILLLDNILVWQGYSRWFHPTKRSDKSVRKVRRFFKIGLMLSVLGHFVLQTTALAIVFYVWKNNLITHPSNLRPFVGFFGGAASLPLDLIFLAFFNYSDQLTFFHTPFSEDEASRVDPKYLRPLAERQPDAEAARGRST
ncbi:hypothetical protein HDV03_001713 [Kappamyces sp. JEL0829]|nr:hypothetical protein HDV03_001713 [Kappamyces sp. JEL0829]